MSRISRNFRQTCNRLFSASAASNLRYLPCARNTFIYIEHYNVVSSLKLLIKMVQIALTTLKKTKVAQ